MGKTKNKRKLICLLKVLGDLNNPLANDTIIYYLHHPDFKVKRETLWILLSKKDLPLELLLIFIIENPQFSELVKTHLIKMGEKIIPDLIEILKDNHFIKKRLVAGILGHLNHEIVLKMLKDELESNSELDTLVVLEILEKYGRKAVQFTPIIMKILTAETDMWVRFQALRTLYSIQSDPISLQLLLHTLIDDPQELVRIEARGLLKDLQTYIRMRLKIK